MIVFIHHKALLPFSSRTVNKGRLSCLFVLWQLHNAHSFPTMHSVISRDVGIFFFCEMAYWRLARWMSETSALNFQASSCCAKLDKRTEAKCMPPLLLFVSTVSYSQLISARYIMICTWMRHNHMVTGRGCTILLAKLSATLGTFSSFRAEIPTLGCVAEGSHY